MICVNLKWQFDRLERKFVNDMAKFALFLYILFIKNPYRIWYVKWAKIETFFFLLNPLLF